MDSIFGLGMVLVIVGVFLRERFRANQRLADGAWNVMRSAQLASTCLMAQREHIKSTKKAKVTLFWSRLTTWSGVGLMGIYIIYKAVTLNG